MGVGEGVGGMWQIQIGVRKGQCDDTANESLVRRGWSRRMGKVGTLKHVGRCRVEVIVMKGYFIA